MTCNGLSNRSKDELCAAWDIAGLADEKGIPVVEPFAGQRTAGGELIVLGPSPEFYEMMLANFKYMPGKDVEHTAFSFARLIESAKAKVLDWIPESWFGETLVEPATDATSAENNSSVIFLLTVAGKKLLFTGDAGVPALVRAANFAHQNNISLTGLTFAQVPHHGSRRNVGAKILNHIFGDIRTTDTPDWTAFISASKDGAPKHPHKKVTNALRRRGGRVVVTAGSTKWHYFNAPPRTGWVAAEVLPFFNMVENDD